MAEGPQAGLAIVEAIAHEPALKKNDAAALAEVAPLAQDADPRVRRQLILSAGWSTTPEAVALIQKIARANVTNPIIELATLTALYGQEELPLVKSMEDGSAFKGIADAAQRNETQRSWRNGIAAWKQPVAAPRKLAADEVALLQLQLPRYRRWQDRVMAVVAAVSE